MKIIDNFKEFMKYQEFRATYETRADTPEVENLLEDLLLDARLANDQITEYEAMQIPAFAKCVNLISGTVGMLPIKLYKEDGKAVEEINNDPRVKLLNDETGDTLDGFQFKKAITRDMLINGAGYAYLNKDSRMNTKSIHYVDHKEVSVIPNLDPIFKKCGFYIRGNPYYEHDFIKYTRDTKDGATGISIIQENSKILSVAYNTLNYENMIVKTGGNKKGFLKSAKKLSDAAMTALKIAWRNLYRNNDESVIVLNDGIDFKEASKTSVEMQLNENKSTNEKEICGIFNVPPEMFSGTFTEAVNDKFIKYTMPAVLESFITSINRVLLKETEKGSFYFAFDTSEHFKGDLEKRFKAYEIASKNGFMQIDEVRYRENLNPLGLPFIKLGLQDVLYNTETGEIYTPNTNKTADMKNLKSEGGEENEN